MSDIEYQKIELHSTYDLVKEQEKIEYERQAAQKLMMENQIQFAIEIDQKEIKSPTGRNTNVVYVLNLIVRKDDVDKVIELLDKEGNFGYYIDLDETFDPMEDEEKTENQEEAFSEFPEELKEEVGEEVNDDPIKMYGEYDNEEENLDDYKIKVESKFKKIDYKSFPKFIMKTFLTIAYMIILILEIIGIVYGIQEVEYEIATAMFVAIVIETPIFRWFYNILDKKE